MGREEKIRSLIRNLKLPYKKKTLFGKSSSDKEVEATSQLLAMRNPLVVDLLVEALAPESGVAPEATELLGKIMDHRAIVPLINVINSPRHPAKGSAITALIGFRDQRSVIPLVKAILNSGNKNPENMLRTVIDFGNPADCLELLKIDHATVKNLASKALGLSGEKRAVGPLLSQLVSQPIYLRQTAADSLAKLGEPQWQACISEDLTNCFKRLAASHDPRMDKLILEETESKDPAICLAAVASFGHEVKPQYKPILLPFLYHNDPAIRLSALDSLARLQDGQLAEAFINLLFDSVPAVRLAAARSLGKLGEKKWLTIIKGEQDDINHLIKAKDRHLLLNLLNSLEKTFGEDAIISTAQAIWSYNEDDLDAPAAMRIVNCVAPKTSDHGASWYNRKRAALLLIEIARKYPESDVISQAQLQSLYRPHFDETNEIERSSDCNITTHNDTGIGLPVE